MIPYGRQDITEADIDAVVDVLRSDFITQGPVVPRFEQAVAAYCGTKHAVATNNATSALHLACLALGLGPGDSLWTSPITFVASANCGLYCGATVDFVDIDPRTNNLCPLALEEKLLQAEKNGCLPKILIPVHLAGLPCDMQSIHALVQKYGVHIIEDASHAIGGKYQDLPIGSGRYSDITVFSFHPVKIITSAEGGMALTNNSELANTMGLLRSHGITRETVQMSKAPDGPWHYQQIALGYNYRLTDMQAALGLSQMARLDNYVNRRHNISNRYDELLRDWPVTLPWQHTDAYSALHLYVIRLQLDNIERSHRAVFETLREHNIGVNLHYIPVYTQPYYQAMGFKTSDFPESQKYYSEAISLPIYPILTSEQQDTVVNVLNMGLGI